MARVLAAWMMIFLIPLSPAVASVIVVGEDAVPVSFSLPTQTPYRLSFPTSPGAPITVWFDRELSVQAASNVTYSAIARGDFEDDDKVNGLDILGFISAIFNSSFDSEADFNADLADDTDDIPYLVDALLYAAPAEGVFLYVSAENASLALDDASIDLLTDPDLDTQFTVSATAPITSLDVSISPMSGHLGAPLTVSISPALGPYVFTGATTAVWEGSYVPSSGTESEGLRISYDDHDVREQSQSQAIILLGSGLPTGTFPPIEDSLPGQLDGKLTIHFSTDSISKSLAITPLGPPPLLATITTDSNGERALGATPSEIEIAMTTTGNGSDENLLSQLSGLLNVVTLSVERNTHTETEAPNSISARLVSRSQAGVVLQEIDALELALDLAASDQDNLVYYSSLASPVVLVDSPLDPASYSLIIPLHAEDGGSISIMPGGL